jgi:hypothetical protein
MRKMYGACSDGLILLFLFCTLFRNWNLNVLLLPSPRWTTTCLAKSPFTRNVLVPRLRVRCYYFEIPCRLHRLTFALFRHLWWWFLWGVIWCYQCSW